MSSNPNIEEENVERNKWYFYENYFHGWEYWAVGMTIDPGDRYWR